MRRTGGPWAVAAVLIGLVAACTPADPERAPTAGTSSGPASSAGPESSAGPASSAPSSAGQAPGSPPAPPPADDVDARVREALAALDRRQQVAQLFVVGVPLADIAVGDALVRDTGVGGIFLRGRSPSSTVELAASTTRWASTAPGPLPWVAADQEGGAVQTLSGPGFARLPAGVEQGRLPAAELAGLADGLGASLAAAGVNLDLAPVVDVVLPGTEAGNPPIGGYGRQYAGDPAGVVAAAGTIVQGLAAHEITATLKHFPGLGRVRGNTDTTADVVDDVTTRYDGQIAAFGALARSSARPFVMMSTATYALIDGSSPAAFSPVVVSDLLRGQLAFDGVVISDDVADARAVAGIEAGERAVRFLAAGGTLVLTVDPTTLPRMLDAVLAHDAADPAFAAHVDDAVRTALRAKAHAGLLPG